MPFISQSDLLSLRHVNRRTGCWEWTGRRNDDGYGVVWFKGKDRGVHRVAAHLFLGFNLNSKVQVLHSCDNPPCFNPKHFFYGTHLDNMHDRDAKGRQWQMRNTHCPQGHLLSRISSGKRRICRECQKLTSREWARTKRDKRKHCEQAKRSYWKNRDAILKRRNFRIDQTA